jgi:hypothetical protein
LVRRFADASATGAGRELIERRMETLVGQRMLGIALGCERLNCYLPLYIFCGRHLSAAKLGAPTSMLRSALARRKPERTDYMMIVASVRAVSRGHAFA